jgi:hypothetical protein
MKIPKPYWRREDGWAATTTAIVMAVVAAAGAATSAVGSYAAGQTRKAAEKYNAQVNENNATMARQQADAEAQKVKEKGRRIIGAQRAALSAAGVDVDSGSAADIGYDSNVQNELDALTTLYKGRVSSNNSLAQAQLDRYSGKQAGQAGAIAAGGTLLSGAANSYGTYNSIKNNPSFD